MSKLNKDLVSIIIPTYNRAHLIGETLDSVIAQTHENWECILVDDGSTDDTEKIVFDYINRDTRIQYHQRPDYKLKGAPSCRNYGVEISKGDFIIFFDSDDLMLDSKLKDHIQVIDANEVDYSISKFDNFTHNSRYPEFSYSKNEEGIIDLKNYLRMNIFWGTIDVLFKRRSITNHMFDEKLNSGQEYNFFCGLLVKKDITGLFFNKVTSLRRLHNTSIQSDQKVDKIRYVFNKTEIFWRTYLRVKDVVNSSEALFLLKRAQSYSYELARYKKINKYFINLMLEIKKQSGVLKSIAFSLGIVSTYSLGKGYILIRKSFP